MHQLIQFSLVFFREISIRVYICVLPTEFKKEKKNARNTRYENINDNLGGRGKIYFVSLQNFYVD